MRILCLKWVITPILCITLTLIIFPIESWTKIISPEEAKLLLEKIYQKQHSQNFWSFWKVESLINQKTYFYEVISLEEKGFLWRNLEEENILFIDSKGWRHIIDLKEGKEIAAYPAVCPFEFLDPYMLDTLLNNYLIEMQSSSVALISRETQKTHKVFLLNKEYNIEGILSFSPQGEALSIAKLIYIDPDLDQNQIAELSKWQIKEPYLEEPTEKDSREVYPLFLPLGFKLKKVYKIVENGRIWRYLVYTDGLYFVSVFYNLFPFLTDNQPFFLESVSKYFKKGTTTLLKKERGNYLLVSGPFREELLKPVLQLFSSKLK